MAVTIAGRQFWLWRAVDDEGEVLDRSCNDGAIEPQR
jgi:transposase-like protein